MPRKRQSAEEIISKLREADVLLGQGKTVAEVASALGINETTYYRGRAEYGGMKFSRAKRLKGLECENVRLRKAVADLSLDKTILQEAARRNLGVPSAAGAAPQHAGQTLDVSERRACRALGQHRPTQRHERRERDDAATLTEAIVRLPERYGRDG